MAACNRFKASLYHINLVFCNCSCVQNGVAAMAWGAAGYRLVLAEAGSAAQVLELSLAKALVGSHRIISRSGAAADGALREPPAEVHLLQVHSTACLHDMLMNIHLQDRQELDPKPC